MKKYPFAYLPLCFLLLMVGCSRPTTPPASYENTGGVTTTPPRLIVMLSIDQMKASYLDRYAELYTGGLKTLRDEGLIYTEAHHDHALTLTAPGHATLSTGCHPNRHGIISNDFYNPATLSMQYAVVDPNVRLTGVDHGGPGQSPVNLAVPAIGDLLKSHNDKSKVYAVASKDRSAILLGGQKPDGAFWFDESSTRYITSGYYTNKYPKWATDLVGRERYAREIAQGWQKKIDNDEAYQRLAGPDDIILENARFLPTFPHTMERMAGFITPEMREITMIANTPLGDRFTLEAAQIIATQYQLGKDQSPDLLMISCSAADIIGHHFGPDSQEVMDYYLYLDEYLASLLQFLDDRIGRQNYLLVMSSDHGVVRMPELAKDEGIDAKRISITRFQATMEGFNNYLQQELGLEQQVIQLATFTGLSLNYAETREKGMADEELQELVAEALRKLDFVADAYTQKDLLSDDDADPFLAVYRLSHFPGRGHEIKMRYRENYLVYYPEYGSSHGSPYRYDTHVPLVFFGSNIKADRINRKVATVDIAPTLSRILRLPVDAGQFDGEILREVMPPSTQ